MGRAFVMGGLLLSGSAMFGCAEAPDSESLGATRQAIDKQTGESEPPPVVSPDGTAERIRCGRPYKGQPYLKCNFDQGSEAIPEMCTRSYVNCEGVGQVYLGTMCVQPIRGSLEHLLLHAACQAYASGSGGRPPPGDPNIAPIPEGFDVYGFMSDADPKSWVEYDDAPPGTVKP